MILSVIYAVFRAFSEGAYYELVNCVIYWIIATLLVMSMYQY